MPARSYRVQKNGPRTKKRIPKVEAGDVSAGGVTSNDTLMSPEHRKDRSVSLSSGPDLADIPAYDPGHASAERTVHGPEDGDMADQETRQLRPISGNEVVGETVREKREHSQRPEQQGALPLFYSYDIEPRLLPLAKRYPAVNPEYFQEIFENRFKPENLAKLSNDFSTSCRSTKKQVKEGDIVRVVNVEADAALEDIKSVMVFHQCFCVYRCALIHVARIRQPGKERLLKAALAKYTGFLIDTFVHAHREPDIVDLRKFHLTFHKQRAIMGIDDPAGWETF